MALTEEQIARMRQFHSGDQTRPPSSGDGTFLGGFVESAVSGIPELFGTDPTEGAERFRAEYPIAGIASQFASALVPYGGWYVASAKLARTAPVVGRALQTGRTGVRAGAAREVTRFAPFEAARAGSRIALGDDPGAVTQEALFGLALEGAFGGVGGFLTAGSTATRRFQELGLLDAAEPPQIQLRQLRRMREEGRTPEAVRDRFERSLHELENSTLTEMPPRNIRRTERARGQESSPREFVKPLWSGNRREINRILRSPIVANAAADPVKHWRRGAIQSRRLIPSETDDAAAVIDQHLGRQNLDSVQFPRMVETRGGATEFVRNVLGEMERVGDGLHITREIHDGLYVVGKDIGDGRFLIFKTENPAKFSDRLNRFAKTQSERMRALRFNPITPPPGVATEQGMLGLQNQMLETTPFERFADAFEKNFDRAGYIKRFNELVGMEKLAETPAGQATRRMLTAMRQNLLPFMLQFKNVRARFLASTMHPLFRAAETNAELAWRGKVSQEQEDIIQGFFGLSLKSTGRNVVREGGLKQHLDKLEPGDLEGVAKAHVLGMTPDEWRGDITISEAAQDFLNRLDEVDSALTTEITQTQKALGISEMAVRRGHVMIPRTWIGDRRVPIVDESGSMIWVASGETNEQAMKAAREALEHLEESGYKARFRFEDEPVRAAGHFDDIGEARLIQTQRPEFRILASHAYQEMKKTGFNPRTFRQRSGMGGFKTAFTRDELGSAVQGHLLQMQRYLADVSFRNDPRILRHLEALRHEDPDEYAALEKRLRQMRGIPTEESQLINRAADRLLAPYLGANSATKLVQAANTFMMNWQLGMGNFMFPALNLTTFMQTGLPQLAYVVNGLKTGRGTAWTHYDLMPLHDGKGDLIGQLGVLSPLKLAGAGLREMKRNSPEFRSAIARAIEDRVIDPRLVEDYVGENSQIIREWRKILDPEGPGVLEFGRAVSEFMPALSEKFARIHAFATAHNLARNVLKVDEDGAYRFARDFTDKTMFLYSTADRPAFMANPVGSAFGMFKNWALHYFGFLMEYGSEAVTRGNWAPLLWQLGGTASVGGLAATPLMPFAEGLSRFMGEENAMTGLYNGMNAMYNGNGWGDSDDARYASDALFYGLPALLGVSMTSSAATPGADPMRDITQMMSFVHASRAQALGQAAAGAMQSFSSTGEHPIQDRRTRDAFMRAFAPRSLIRATQVAEGNFVRSMHTGYPLVSDVTPSQRWAYGLGFTPTEVDREFRVSQEIWSDQNRMRREINTISNNILQAYEARDYEGASRLVRRAMLRGISYDSIQRSLNSQQQKAEQDVLTRGLPNRQAEFRNVLD